MLFILPFDALCVSSQRQEEHIRKDFGMLSESVLGNLEDGVFDLKIAFVMRFVKGWALVGVHTVKKTVLQRVDSSFVIVAVGSRLGPFSVGFQSQWQGNARTGRLSRCMSVDNGGSTRSR